VTVTPFAGPTALPDVSISFSIQYTSAAAPVPAPVPAPLSNPVPVSAPVPAPVPVSAPVPAPVPMPTTPSPVIPAGGQFQDLLINCGGPEKMENAGVRIWEADQYFDGGRTFSAGGMMEIENTLDDVIYQTERTGEFSYAVPVPPGMKHLWFTALACDKQFHSGPLTFCHSLSAIHKVIMKSSYI